MIGGVGQGTGLGAGTGRGSLQGSDDTWLLEGVDIYMRGVINWSGRYV